MRGLVPRHPALLNAWNEAEVVDSAPIMRSLEGACCLLPRHVAPLAGDGLDDSPLQRCRARGEVAVARQVVVWLKMALRLQFWQRYNRR